MGYPEGKPLSKEQSASGVLYLSRVINRISSLNGVTALLAAAAITIFITGCGGGTVGSNPPVKFLLGSVVDNNGNPAGNASIAAGENKTKTDKEGDFYLDLNLDARLKTFDITITSEDSKSTFTLPASGPNGEPGISALFTIGRGVTDIKFINTPPPQSETDPAASPTPNVTPGDSDPGPKTTPTPGGKKKKKKSDDSDDKSAPPPTPTPTPTAQPTPPSEEINAYIQVVDDEGYADENARVSASNKPSRTTVGGEAWFAGATVDNGKLTVTVNGRTFVFSIRVAEGTLVIVFQIDERGTVIVRFSKQVRDETRNAREKAGILPPKLHPDPDYDSSDKKQDRKDGSSNKNGNGGKGSGKDDNKGSGSKQDSRSSR